MVWNSFCPVTARFKKFLSPKTVSLRYFLQVLEGVVSRLFCQRALWQRDPQRVTKFLLLSARDQFRKRMNEQGGMVSKTTGIYFVDTSWGKTREMFKI